MGGRGASSGISREKSEKKYGSEYRSILNIKNIKFLVPNQGTISAPLETMTRKRVYVIVDNKSNVGYICFYDNNGKKNKQIDIDRHPHSEKGVQLGKRHVHLGYEHDEKGSRTMTTGEKIFVENILKIWEDYKRVQ